MDVVNLGIKLRKHNLFVTRLLFVFPSAFYRSINLNDAISLLKVKDQLHLCYLTKAMNDNNEVISDQVGLGQALFLEILIRRWVVDYDVSSESVEALSIEVTEDWETEIQLNC